MSGKDGIFSAARTSSGESDVGVALVAACFRGLRQSAVAKDRTKPLQLYYALTISDYYNLTAMNSSHYRLTDDLRKGRISLPYARYFITCASKRPQKRMIESTPALTIKNAMKHLEDCGDITLLCGTIMPDHVHLLAVLKDTLSIGQVVGKFKALTKTSLLQHDICWQRNYFEHRLHADEPATNYARYIFLNPYRSGLICRESEWSHWMKNPDIDFDFMAYLEKGRCPPEEWLDAPLEKLGINPQYMGND